MATACAGSTISFNIYTYDPDPTQTLTLSWNNAISGAIFTISGGQNPTGIFSWTPTMNDVGAHCFTITVTDNNCPINGSQTYSICLVVYGVDVNVVTTNANCSASNGTATATISGGTSPFTYLWLPCGCQNNPLNGLQAGTYTIMVTDAKGCTASDTGTVNTGYAPGNVSMSFTPVSCYGANDATATANANGGQPPYTYLWSNGDTTQTITGLSVGNYYVSVTTADGCVKTDSIMITQPSQLNVLVTQNDASCFGMSNGSASVSPSGGTPPYSYQWSNGQTTQSVTGLSTGNYFVTTTDSKGCVDVQNVFIGEPTQVVLSIFSLINVSCFGGSNGTATAVTYGGVSPYTYMWNTIPIQTTQIATGLSAGSYIVTVIDNNGCIMMTSVTISAPALLSSLINSANVKCFGGNSGTASVNVSGGTSPYSYLWSNGATQSQISNLTSQVYNVTITDANGCVHTNTVSITQPSLLAASITNIQNVSCSHGSNGSASANGNGGISPYSYLWSNGQTTSAVVNFSAGNYSVTITDVNGCTATHTLTITEPNAILVITTPDDTICPNQNTTISASASGGTSPFTYFWQPNVGFGNSQTVNPTSTTTYTVIITDANGCTATGTTTMSTYNMNMTVVMNAVPSICLGQSVTLSAAVTGNNITHYYWHPNLGNGAGPYTVSPNTTTTYSVTITNSCGATVTSSVTIVVHPLPQINLSPQNEMGCDAVTFQFSDTNSSNNGSTYYWSFGDGTHSASANPSHTYTQSGAYNVSVTITSPYGCTAAAQTYCTVSVVVSPDADFTSDPPLETSIIQPDFRFFDQSTNATVWNWDFGDGTVSSLQNPNHTYSQTGIYKVKLITINNGGCMDSIIKTVEVLPEFTFYIPNTFTPNGDHLNDVFNGKGMEITEYEMLVFDRWGNQIFKTNDLNLGWDGRANEGVEIAQQDVYVYKIQLRDFSGKPHYYNGQVNLIK